MVCNIHRPNLYRVFVPIMGKRLNGKNRDIRSGIENYGFVQNFLSVLRRDTAKRNEHPNQFVIIRSHKTIDFRVVLGCAICEFDFYIVSCCQTIAALTSLPFARINILFSVRLAICQE